MEITCPRCQTRHLIDFPATARARPARSPRFRCSHCGHTFAVDPVTPAAAPTPTPEPTASGEPPRPAGDAGSTPAAAPPGELIQMLQSNGQIWPVPDMATLHRWILEGRVGRADLVSNHGMRWQRIGDRADLELFFTAADRLRDAANRRDVVPFDPATSRVAEDEVFVETGEASAEEVARPGAVSFSTLIPPNVDEPPDTTQVGDVHFGRDGDTQEQTIHSVDEIRVGLPPIVPEAPEPTAHLRGVRTVRPMDLPREATQEPEPTQELRKGRKPVMPAPVVPADPVFSEMPSGPGFAHTPRVAGDVFDDPPSTAERGRGTWMFIGGVGSLAAAIIVAAIVVVVARGGDTGAAHTATTAGAGSGAPVAVTPAPAVEAPKAEVPKAGAPVEVPKAEAQKAEAPKAEAPKAEAPKAEAPRAEAQKAAAPKAEAPKAAAPKATTTASSSAGGASALVAQAWKAVEAEDYLKAQGLFDKALQKKPGDPKALYGRGYATEKLGDTVSAGMDYCDAQSHGPDAEMAREISAGLRRVGRNC